MKQAYIQIRLQSEVLQVMSSTYYLGEHNSTHNIHVLQLVYIFYISCKFILVYRLLIPLYFFPPSLQLIFEDICLFVL